MEDQIRELGHLSALQFRVLSIQSSVTYGYVGNKAASFPLQLLGIDVDPIHTVQLCNHNGYPVVRGHRTKGEDVAAIFEGLQGNGMDRAYQVVLSGYIGSKEVTETIATNIRQWIEQRNGRSAVLPNGSVARRLVDAKRRGDGEATSDRVLYICDPVLGDNGKMYVPEEVVEVYRQALVPLADVVLPNGFEASVLTGVTVHSLSTAAEAAQWFHERGVTLVVIKSFHVDGAGDQPLSLYASYRDAQQSTETFVVHVPVVDGQFSGTGDLFASLLVGYFLESYCTLKHAILRAVSSMQDILLATQGGSSSLPVQEKGLKSLELRFLHHAALLLNPRAKKTESALRWQEL